MRINLMGFGTMYLEPLEGYPVDSEIDQKSTQLNSHALARIRISIILQARKHLVASLMREAAMPRCLLGCR